MTRIAALPYVNTAPLVHYILRACPCTEVVFCPPSKSLSLLIEGVVDVAMIPIIDFLTASGLKRVEGIGICANGEVDSVLLKCGRPLQDVRHVRLCPESRTSNILVQVLLQRMLSSKATIYYSHSETPFDAEVVIGDRALTSPPVPEQYDLAKEWKRLTGLPFVFAVWVHRSGRRDFEELSRILHEAKEIGCNHLRELSELHAARLGLPVERVYHYLTERIFYSVGPSEDLAIQKFAGMIGQSTSVRVNAFSPSTIHKDSMCFTLPQPH
jgi:chorismate dehydratase